MTHPPYTSATSKRKPVVDIGGVYGRLTVLEHVGSNRFGKRIYRCQCVCGGICVVIGSQLSSGSTQSCGCFARERRAANGRRNRGHGRYASSLPHSAGMPEHNSWLAMIQRCSDPSHRSFQHYGGRGIAVCDRWTGLDGFAHFVEDMGPRPADRSLDRIDVHGNYEPGNCRWATPLEQAANRQAP